jgi:LacI family transcriptional regulator
MVKRPTLRFIAQQARVSHMTVSLALRGSPDIPLATRERIQLIADTLGYRPDPIIAKVMSHLRFPKEDGRTLAFLTRFDGEEWKKHPTFGSVFKGASARARELGYQLEEFRMNEPKMTAKRISLILRTRSITGAIVAATPHNMSHSSLNFENLSAVALGYSVVRPMLHRVANHQIHTLLLAARQMRRLGNNRLGVVMLEATDERSDYNWTAGLGILQKHLPTSRHIPMYTPREWNFDHFADWFQKHRPDAVLGMCEHLVEWMTKLGLRVPRDVQIAALDLSQASTPRTSGVDQRHYLVGAVSVDMLLGQMYLNERGVPPVPRTVLVEGQWVDGPTAVKRER